MKSESAIPFEKNKAPGFASSIAAPRDSLQRSDWDAANRQWWEVNPMRYDWNVPLPQRAGEREWYQELDRRFFTASVVPHTRLPFDSLIPFEELRDLDVLEIGVGMGAHAQLLAGHARRFVGVDVTQAAVAATRRRFQLFGLRGSILRMHAEALAFPDNSFDLVWSWGVIHHTADTQAALRQIHRVLRPGGRALLMVYHRAIVPWYVYEGFIRGVLLGRLRRYGSIHGVVQSATDGALARYYSGSEWRKQVSGMFRVEQMMAFGNRAEAVPLPAGRVKEAALRHTPEAALRFWLTGLAQGKLLFTSLIPVKGEQC